MKTNHFSASYKFLTVVTTCFLSAASIQAQTFTGQEKLAAMPVGLEASIYPVTNTPSTVRLNFNNLTAGGVRVVIRDEKGQEVYSEFETVAKYRRRFDLSAMPAGTYTIELKKQNDLFTQSFTVQPPVQGYITMGNKPVQKAPVSPVDKKLIVSY